MSISPAGLTLGYTTALNDVDIIIITIIILYEVHLNSYKWGCVYFTRLVGTMYVLHNIGEESFIKHRNVSVIQVF